MKKQNTVRRLISSALCFVILISCFAVFASAAVTPRTLYCPNCGGVAKWYEEVDFPTEETHEYHRFDSSVGKYVSGTCTITTVERYQECVCMGCGRVVLTNSYIASVSHSDCGA